MNWKIVGHTLSKHILEKQIESNQFAHAYLFLGPEGVGKRTLAVEFAQKIRQMPDGIDPDIEELNITPDFGVEDMRSFLARTALRPMHGQYKFAILDNVQNLNIQSSNALLKTLEEPSSSAIIILVATSRTLPATIFSRVQILDFNRLSNDQLTEFAKQAGIGVSQALISHSGGMVARLIRLAQDENFYKQTIADSLLLQDLSNTSSTIRIASVQHLADREGEDLQELCRSWLIYSRQRLATNPSQSLLEWLRELDILASYFSNSALNKKFLVQRLLRAVPKHL